MKILWVKPGKLLPLDSGGKLRSYHLLRQISKTHDLTFLSYYAGPEDRDYELEIMHRLPGAVTVPDAYSEPKGIGRHVDYIRHLPALRPYAVSRFSSLRVQSILANWMAARRFDVAICDFLVSAQNFPRALNTPTVLFQHNVETLLWKRRASVPASPVNRLISKLEFTKMARYEPSQVRRFHQVFAVSETDRQEMASMVDPSRISVIPTGVDLSEYRYDPKLEPAGPLVVFTGSMDWEPNIDGVGYFCRDVWPRVVAAVPNARFRIVGRKPAPSVRKLSSASIEVTGTVPSIVEHLREAAVLVVPLRTGGGTRIKIYEGMAMGKATVSTSVGAEGLDVQHERDILLADDPSRFAEYIVKLLRDDQFRRRYESAAARAVLKFDWSRIAESFVMETQRAIEAASRDRSVRTTLPNPENRGVAVGGVP